MALVVKIDIHETPRTFKVGLSGTLELADCAHIHPSPNEQVTFFTESGAQYDVARKDWGYYATPSLNGRLEGFGLRAVLTRNAQGRYFVLLVERGREAAFEEYVRVEEQQIVCWMDSTEALEALETRVSGGVNRGSTA